ncbi:hypothetical protein T11_17060 [Trichinella zimbabwensis]|uniref:Uncharacterized protein n=1 Tax=Trichinella zimbabwensis TaxID=268475 RepID=A0A0V1I8V1_9BILA|nr:hypothetical protein T11_17060 [Trichinella zimbabwensis]
MKREQILRQEVKNRKRPCGWHPHMPKNTCKEDRQWRKATQSVQMNVARHTTSTLKGYYLLRAFLMKQLQHISLSISIEMDPPLPNYKLLPAKKLVSSLMGEIYNVKETNNSNSSIGT